MGVNYGDRCVILANLWIFPIIKDIMGVFGTCQLSADFKRFMISATWTRVLTFHGKFKIVNIFDYKIVWT